MKYILLFPLLLFSLFTLAQANIDTGNYHQYLSPKNLKGNTLTTDFLRLNDVVPVMMEELKNAGHDWLYDRTIYQLQNGQVFTVSAYSRKSNIGFLYIEGHGIFPGKEDRNILFKKDNAHVKYTECYESYDGKAKFVKIESIPSNIFVLKEDCYFFQYTNNSEDNNVLVTKEIAIKILRQDIKRYLASVPLAK